MSKFLYQLSAVQQLIINIINNIYFHIISLSRESENSLIVLNNNGSLIIKGKLLLMRKTHDNMRTVLYAEFHEE